LIRPSSSAVEAALVEANSAPSPPAPQPARPAAETPWSSILAEKERTETSAPTTSWALWVNQNNPDNSPGGGSSGQGAASNGPTATGSVVIVGNYTPTNETDDWFSPETWSERPEEEEEKGILDKVVDTIDFWNDGENSVNAVKSEVLFLLSVVVVWAVVV